MRQANLLGRGRDTMLLSGWLFADLLLGLMIIFLVSTPGSPPVPTPTVTPSPTPTSTPTVTPSPSPLPTVTPSPTPTSSPTVTPSPTPLPTITPSPLPILSLNQQPEKFEFRADVSGLLNGNPTELDRLRQEIRGTMSRLTGQRAGIILTFGTASDPGTATSLSRAFNALMRDTLPGTIDNNTVLRDFITLNTAQERQGTIEVEVYLFLE